jgi:hypothetical protein
MEITCNIYKGKCELKIPDGYYKCYKCHGVGCTIDDVYYKEKYMRVRMCLSCRGEGIVDWITNINKRDAIFGFIGENRNIYCPKDKKCKVIKRFIKNWRRGLI